MATLLRILLVVVVSLTVPIATCYADKGAVQKQMGAVQKHIDDGWEIGLSAKCDNAEDTCWWVDSSYVLWFRQGSSLPPLVTTSLVGTPANSGTPNFAPIAGAMGRPTTTVLFGDERVVGDPESGIDFQIGQWFDHKQNVGVGVRFFGALEERVSFDRQSSGAPTLAVPFFNTDTAAGPAEDAYLVAFTDPALGVISSGRVHAETINDFLGGEAFLRSNWYRCDGASLDLLAGYLFTQVDDVTGLNTQLRVEEVGGIVPRGTLIHTADRLEATNSFHGATLGFMAAFQRHQVQLRVGGKVGFGNMNQRISIRGTNVIVDPPQLGGGSRTGAGGLFAQSTNSRVAGAFEQDKFAFVPEWTIAFDYHVSDSIDLSVGYTLLYWSSVALSEDQLDRVVNDNQFGGGGLAGGPARPEFQFHDSAFWAQGLNFGICARY